MKTVLLILLVASLAFNVRSTVDYFRDRKQVQRSQTVEGRAQIMAEKLDLDEQQHKVFKDLFDRFAQLRQTRITQRDEFFAELIKNESDQKLLENFWAGDSANGHRLATLALIQDFVAILRPDQREAFVEILKNKRLPSRNRTAPEGE